MVRNPDKVATNWPIPLSQADAARWKAQQIAKHGKLDGPVSGGRCLGRTGMLPLIALLSSGAMVFGLPTALAVGLPATLLW